MTPATFAARFRSTAEAVSTGTGIDPMVLLAQWANETSWGTVVVGNNLGNIRCSPTSFCRYATLDDFATACVGVFKSGPYAAVLAANTAEQQLAAICASPWSSGHYGGSLHPFYDPLEGFEMTPDESQKLTNVDARVLVILQLLNGAPPNVPPSKPAPFTTLLASVAGIKSDVSQIKAALANIPVGGTLTPAQAQQLQEAHDAIQRIEAAFRAA